MTSSDQDEVLRVVTREGELEVRGQVLGRASSQIEVHNHDLAAHTAPYRRCSACRWTEITLVRRGDGNYVLINEGLTSVEGEVPYGRISHAQSAEDAVERLYRIDRRGANPAVAFLPVVARKALLRAAEKDPDIADSMRRRRFL